MSYILLSTVAIVTPFEIIVTRDNVTIMMPDEKGKLGGLRKIQYAPFLEYLILLNIAERC